MIVKLIINKKKLIYFLSKYFFESNTD